MTLKNDNMKWRAILLLAMFGFNAVAQNLLTGNFRTLSTGIYTNVTMTLTLISQKNLTLSTNLISNDNGQAITDAAGNFAFTNIIPGVYSLSAGDNSTTRWRVPVYTNTLGTVPLASLINAGGTPPNPATNYVTQAQLVASVYGVGNFVPGNNITFTTNSTAVAINSSGGGSANAVTNGPGWTLFVPATATNRYKLSGFSPSWYNGTNVLNASRYASSGILEYTNTAVNGMTVYLQWNGVFANTWVVGTNMDDPDLIAYVPIETNTPINQAWSQFITDIPLPAIQIYGDGQSASVNDLQANSLTAAIATEQSLYSSLITATNITINADTNSRVSVIADGNNTHNARVEYNINDVSGSTEFNAQNIGTMAFEMGGNPQGVFEQKGYFNGDGSTGGYGMWFNRANPDWASRVGGLYFFELSFNDIGQVAVGWLNKGHAYSYSDVNKVTSPAFLSVYGQSDITNCAALYLAPGLPTSNAIAGDIQSLGTNFSGTITNLDGTKNTLPFFMNGQSVPLVATGSITSYGNITSQNPSGPNFSALHADGSAEFGGGSSWASFHFDNAGGFDCLSINSDQELTLDAGDALDNGSLSIGTFPNIYLPMSGNMIVHASVQAASFIGSASGLTGPFPPPVVTNNQPSVTLGSITAANSTITASGSGSIITSGGGSIHTTAGNIYTITGNFIAGNGGSGSFIGDGSGITGMSQAQLLDLKRGINFTNGGNVGQSMIGPYTGPIDGISFYATNASSGNGLADLMDLFGVSGNLVLNNGSFTGKGSGLTTITNTASLGTNTAIAGSVLMTGDGAFDYWSQSFRWKNNQLTISNGVDVNLVFTPGTNATIQVIGASGTNATISINTNGTVSFQGTVTGLGTGLTNASGQGYLGALPTSAWTNVITTNGVSFTNIFRFDGTNAWLTLQSTNGTSQPLLYTVTNNQVLLTGNGAGVTNLNASQLLSGTVPLAEIPAGVAQTSLRNIFTVPQAVTASDGAGSGLIFATNTASSSFIAAMTLLGPNLTSGQEIFYRFGKDATLNTNAASIGFTWIGNGSALNSMDFSFTGLGRFMQLFGDGHVNANGSGITNIQPFLIQTNFNSGQPYTNTYGCAITVCANVVNTVAAVAGSSDIALMAVASPTVGGWTNHEAIQSFLTSIAMNYTNVISIYVPTNAAYWFTNLSAGALNSSTVIGGQIKYP